MKKPPVSFCCSLHVNSTDECLKCLMVHVCVHRVKLLIQIQQASYLSHYFEFEVMSLDLLLLRSELKIQQTELLCNFSLFKY